MHERLNSVSENDIRAILHPYTNARRHEVRGPTVIERGEGIYVFDDQGNRYIEGLAGLWSVAVGFGERRLVEAAVRQFERLPYYHLFAHKTHGPATKLGEKLVELTPEKLSRVFFTNSGSEANDTVVKLLWFYNNALGRRHKKKIISRVKAYHGITVASGSLTGLPLNHGDFDLPIPGILHTSCPHHYRFANPGETEPDFATRLADDLDRLITSEGSDTVAAFIAEPVMAAGGVIVPPETYWEKIQAVCRSHDVLIVADEVITGFGRTGTWFASERYSIEPDILVLSKQISSSYQPLGAVMISDELYQVVADNSDRLGSFGHGFTCSGHPVAAAVAIENLKIIEERGLVDNAARVGAHMQNALRQFQDHPLVGEIRGVGLIAGVELVADRTSKAPFDPPGLLGAFIFERAHKHGLIIRNIQDTIAFCPPLIITEAQVDDMVDRFARTMKDAEEFAMRGAV